MKIILVLELQGFASVILPLLGLLSPRLGSFEGAPRTLLRSLFVFDHIMQSIFYTLWLVSLDLISVYEPLLTDPLYDFLILLLNLLISLCITFHSWSILWGVKIELFGATVKHIGSQSVARASALAEGLVELQVAKLSCALLCAVRRRYWTQTWLWVQCRRWIFRPMFKECPVLFFLLMFWMLFCQTCFELHRVFLKNFDLTARGLRRCVSWKVSARQLETFLSLHQGLVYLLGAQKIFRR